MECAYLTFSTEIKSKSVLTKQKQEYTSIKLPTQYILQPCPHSFTIWTIDMGRQRVQERADRSD